MLHGPLCSWRCDQSSARGAASRAGCLFAFSRGWLVREFAGATGSCARVGWRKKLALFPPNSVHVSRLVDTSCCEHGCAPLHQSCALRSVTTVMHSLRMHFPRILRRNQGSDARDAGERLARPGSALRAALEEVDLTWMFVQNKCATEGCTRMVGTAGMDCKTCRNAEGYQESDRARAAREKEKARSASKHTKGVMRSLFSTTFRNSYGQYTCAADTKRGTPDSLSRGASTGLQSPGGPVTLLRVLYCSDSESFFSVPESNSPGDTVQIPSEHSGDHFRNFRSEIFGHNSVGI